MVTKEVKLCTIIYGYLVSIWNADIPNALESHLEFYSTKEDIDSSAGELWDGVQYFQI
jgi:hypothetical protein